jgi:hypothetical protein
MREKPSRDAASATGHRQARCPRRIGGKKPRCRLHAGLCREGGAIEAQAQKGCGGASALGTKRPGRGLGRDVKDVIAFQAQGVMQ